MSSSTRGVVPMYPINPARATEGPGRATVDQRTLRPRIPGQFWTGVQPGAVTTAANTPNTTPGVPSFIPGAPPVISPIPGAAATGDKCCG